MKENHGLAHSCYSWGNLSHHLALLFLIIVKLKVTTTLLAVCIDDEKVMSQKQLRSNFHFV